MQQSPNKIVRATALQIGNTGETSPAARFYWGFGRAVFLNMGPGDFARFLSTKSHFSVRNPTLEETYCTPTSYLRVHSLQYGILGCLGYPFVGGSVYGFTDFRSMDPGLCTHMCTHTLAAHIHTYTYTQTQKCGSGYLCLWLRGLHVLRVQGPDRSIDEDAEFEVKH